LRYFIQLSFSGTAYHGWQLQENAVSVQAVLNDALGILLKHEINTTGCGRTDTGVHAKKFFAHFDSDLSLETLNDFIHQLNCILPPDIAVRGFIPVAADAHARFDARSRTYEYSIHQNKDPFRLGYSWYFAQSLDLDLMNEMASLLLAYHDFSCFSKSGSRNPTHNCTVTFASWTENEGRLLFRITANRFLRNMVRAIVGTLIEGGKNNLGIDDFKSILESKNRSEAGPSVPAHGLSLTDVVYPYIKNE